MEKENFFNEMQRKYMLFEESLHTGVAFDLGELEAILMADFFSNFNMCDRSVKLLEYGLESYPDSQEIKKFLSFAYISLNQLKKAEKLLDEIKQHDPTNLFVILANGAYCLKTDQKKLALELFEIIEDLASHKEKTQLLYRIGVALVQANMPEEAMTYYGKCLEINPDQLFAKMGYASCFNRLGNWEKALEQYKEILEKTPYVIYAWYSLGDIYRQQGMLDEAIEAYDYVLAIDPTSAPAMYNKAQILLKQKKAEEAAEIFCELNSKEIDKESRGEILIYLLECYNILERYEEIINVCKQLVFYYPDSVNGWSGMSMSYLNLGEWEKSIVPLKTLLSIDPDLPDYWQYLGMAYDEKDMRAEAVEAYLEAYNRQEKNIYLIIRLINACDASGRMADALKYSLEAFEIQPDTKGLDYGIGALYHQLGRLDELKAHLKMLMERGNVDAPLLFLESYPPARYDLAEFTAQYYPDYDPDAWEDDEECFTD